MFVDGLGKRNISFEAEYVQQLRDMLQPPGEDDSSVDIVKIQFPGYIPISYSLLWLRGTRFGVIPPSILGALSLGILLPRVDFQPVPYSTPACPPFDVNYNKEHITLVYRALVKVSGAHIGESVQSLTVFLIPAGAGGVTQSQ